MICYGHTHRPEWRQVETTWILNPGAVDHDSPPTLAILEVPDLRLHSVTR